MCPGREPNVGGRGLPRPPAQPLTIDPVLKRPPRVGRRGKCPHHQLPERAGGVPEQPDRGRRRPEPVRPPALPPAYLVPLPHRRFMLTCPDRDPPCVRTGFRLRGSTEILRENLRGEVRVCNRQGIANPPIGKVFLGFSAWTSCCLRIARSPVRSRLCPFTASLSTTHLTRPCPRGGISPQSWGKRPQTGPATVPRRHKSIPSSRLRKQAGQAIVTSGTSWGSRTATGPADTAGWRRATRPRAGGRPVVQDPAGP
jgi:hypothetical protein